MILGNASKVNFNVKPIEHFKNKIQSVLFDIKHVIEKNEKIFTEFDG